MFLQQCVTGSPHVLSIIRVGGSEVPEIGLEGDEDARWLFERWFSLSPFADRGPQPHTVMMTLARACPISK